jgi:hypothetical protein
LRKDDLDVFYRLISKLEQAIGGARKLSDCSGYLDWPNRGVYFFQEAGELRDNSNQLRIVRVGTHALKTGSKTKIWNRLSQHKGQQRSGGGNHRGSIFRLIIGTSIIKKDSLNYPTWGQGNSADKITRELELLLERTVSETIGNMPFLWLKIEDEANPQSIRGFIERNSIALLSNYSALPCDAPSQNWLGNRCDRERVRKSGLWNSNHVDESYDPTFLDTFERLIDQLGNEA